MIFNRKGLWLAVVHLILVASLFGKLLVDRAIYPRAWARTATVDPNLPIRGRYLSLRLEVTAGDNLVWPSLPPARPGAPWQMSSLDQRVALVVRQNSLVAVPSGRTTALDAFAERRGSEVVGVLRAPLAFFIADTAADPTPRTPGDELWVEVTVPPTGSPRPIRLGVKRQGVLTPVDRR